MHHEGAPEGIAGGTDAKTSRGITETTPELILDEEIFKKKLLLEEF